MSQPPPPNAFAVAHAAAYAVAYTVAQATAHAAHAVTYAVAYQATHPPASFVMASTATTGNPPPLCPYSEETKRDFMAWLHTRNNRELFDAKKRTQYRFWLTATEQTIYGTPEEKQIQRNQRQEAVKKFFLKDNHLYRRRETEEEEDKYVLCDYNVLKAIEDRHLALECAGSNKTFNYMAPRYYGVTKAICEWLSKKCRLCRKTGKNQSRAPLQPIITDYVHHQMQLDLVDLRSRPDRHTYAGKTMCWVTHFKDCKSKHSVLMAMENKKASTVAACIDLYIRFLGCPDIMQMDNGREFKGACLIHFRKHGIRVINGRPR